MKQLAILITMILFGSGAIVEARGYSSVVTAQKKGGDKESRKKDTPGPPVVRDKKDREKEKEPPPKPKKP